MNKKQYRLYSAKSMIRAMEGLLELVILALVYYYIWRREYSPSSSAVSEVVTRGSYSSIFGSILEKSMDKGSLPDCEKSIHIVN